MDIRRLKMGIACVLGIVGCSIPAQAMRELPDTLYTSVADIEYHIEVLDTVTSPLLSGVDDLYLDAPGIFTFRGSPYRDMTHSGTLDSIPTRIERVWVFRTDYDDRETDYGVWGGGSGWTGQPVYVEWSEELQQKQRRSSKALTSAFGSREIIVGSLCGNVYFIDYESGRASRREFVGKNPIKGSVSLDPRLNGNLYVGQGIPSEDNKIGAVVFNIFTHESISYYGRDPEAWRRWGAYDASAVVVDDFVLRPSENGTIYKLKVEADRVAIHSKMRYRRKGKGAAGIESSPVVYKDYLYTADNHGNILCTNINTLKPVWCFDNMDDIDATMVLAEEEECGVVLYVGSELDKRGSSGYCYFTKLNALTGELIWQNKIKCRKMGSDEKPVDGGMFSTPLLGDGNCEGLIFTNICGMGSSDLGTFVAIDRLTGEIVYKTRLNNYAWSSPVAFYAPGERMYVFTGDVVGNAYLIDAESGRIIFRRTMANNFESSPVVVDNSVVVGSRGREIYRFRIL